MNASIFGAPSAATVEFFRQKQELDATTAIEGTKSRFADNAREVFDIMLGNEAMAMVRIAINNTAAVARPDVVSRMMNLEDLQGARPVMQAFIMANPVVRNAYHKGFCNGYEGSYVDEQPHITGPGHRHYDAVQEGTLEFNEEGFTYTNSSNGFSNGRATLEAEQWGDIKATWRLAEKIMREGEHDLTNPRGGSL